MKNSCARVFRGLPLATSLILGFPEVLSVPASAALNLTCAPNRTVQCGSCFAGSNLIADTVLHGFSFSGGDGQSPQGSLVEGTNGALYGTTPGGGSHFSGTIFTVNKDGTGYNILRNLDGSNDGGSPTAGLFVGSDGLLYGTARNGGPGFNGTVFKLNHDGTGFTVVRSFNGMAGDGYSVQAGVVEGSDGVLYGATYGGGSAGAGTLFKVNKDGTGYMLMHSFLGQPTDGANPVTSLLEGSDGALYGVAPNGGNDNKGVVFKINKAGTGYAILRSFVAAGRGADGQNPVGPLIEGADGNLYGATSAGGIGSAGGVFAVSKNGSVYSFMFSFSGSGTQGQSPAGGLIRGPNGDLYGTAAYAGSGGRGTVFHLNTDGTGFNVVYAFTGSTDPANPAASLLLASDGALHGTSPNGGTGSLGTVFRLGCTLAFDPPMATSDCGTGSLTVAVLGTVTNGAGCSETITRTWSATDGCGNSNGCSQTITIVPFILTCSTNKTVQCGSCFADSNLVAQTVLYMFGSITDDGRVPLGALVEGTNGALFGTTSAGGTTLNGAVYTLNKDGSGYTIIKTLNSASDGGSPSCALIVGSDGLLYGTAAVGGSAGSGTVFKLNQNGSGFTVLLNFTGTSGDGANPGAGVIEGHDGILYGTTASGGSGLGTIFSLRKDGSSYAPLHVFSGTGTEGARPNTSLLEGSDGALYGVTPLSTQFGVVFKINKNGTGYTVLRDFSGGDGETPSGALIEGPDGYLYGVTENANGNLFKLKKDGSAFGIVHTFSPSGSDGLAPGAALVFGNDGALYGTAVSGGSGARGTVFRVYPDGAGFKVIRAFTPSSSDPHVPNTSLLLASDGAFYGASESGGTYGFGTVYQLACSQITFDPPSVTTGCGGSNVTITVLSTITNGTGCAENLTRTWLATDVCGNTNTCSQTITIADTTPPYIVCGTNRTVECGTPWTFDSPATYDDCCGTNVTITVLDTTTNGSCPQLVTRTWQATDCCGNPTNCSQTVTIVDTTPPTISCAGDKTVECGTAWVFDPPSVSDICSGTNITLSIINLVTNGFCPSLITVTWQATDLCGNINTCTQTVTVVDTTPPVLTCAPDKTVECGSAWDFDPPTAWDACSGTNVSISFPKSGGTLTNGSCPQLVSQIWIANDPCGNSSTCTQTVAIVDTTPPVVTCASNKTVACGTCGTNSFDITLLHNFSYAGNLGTFPQAALLAASDGASYGTASRGGTNGGGTVFKLNPDGSGYTVLHHFSGLSGDGADPLAAVIEGSDGALYGTTAVGGSGGNGTVFKINKDGSGYMVLHSFGVGDGQTPFGALLQASDGVLYGTTFLGGSSGNGTAFKMNLGGSGYAIIRNFAGGTDVSSPQAALVEGIDGALYGTSSGGGAHILGTVFRLTRSGASLSIIHSFGDVAGDGSAPQTPLLSNGGGVLYGTTAGGGAGEGTVFRLNQDGSAYSILRSLSFADGYSPQAGLLEGSDGVLYGTAELGGAYGSGTVFKLNQDGTAYTVIHDFNAPAGDGYSPFGELIELGGMLYGTTREGGAYNAGAVFTLDTIGGNYSVLTNFTGGDGYQPQSGLLAGGDGALYGTTVSGGASGGTRTLGGGGPTEPGKGGGGGGGGGGPGDSSRGVVFRINQDGSGYTVIHNFGVLPQGSSDGANPLGALVTGRDNALYGTTTNGGSFYGTVFKLNRDGTGYRILKAFSSISGGKRPMGGLLAASDGVLYGTTVTGGTGGQGVVFKIALDGSAYTELYNFTGSSGDGAAPVANLIEGDDGALYGTTLKGGVANGGTLFKLNKNGSGYAVLRTLASADGTAPRAGLIEASDGDLYGTASTSGGYSLGTVFKLHKDGGGFMVLHDFRGGGGPSRGNDGSNPYAGLIEGSDGLLYGATAGGSGPDSSAATIFSLGKDGSGYAVLKTFGDGSQPYGALAQAGGGFYGTAYNGGSDNLGNVFKFSCPFAVAFDVPTAFDACSGLNVTISVLSTVTNGTCPRFITRTWAASDLCNNTNTCGQTITITDTNPPVITCAANKTVECASVWDFDAPTATDSCCTNVTVKVLNTATNGVCPQLISRTWQAMDCCSNVSTCTQTVTVVDTTPPAITCAGNKTVVCGSAWNFDPPTASDVCSGTNVTIAVSSTVDNGMCPQVLTRTWVATDLCGNANTCSQAVTLVHVTPPTLSCAANKTVDCGSVWSFDPPTALDDCSGTNVTIVPVGAITNGTGCHLIISRTWQATDVCGNMNTCTQTVTVVDTTPPVLTCSSNKTVQCGTCGPGGAPFDFMVLHTFGLIGNMGQTPEAAVLVGSDGALYGTTSTGGTNGNGTVFRLNADGSGYTVLHHFSGLAGDGAAPVAAVIEGGDGALYGTTAAGGSGGNGTVFKINKDGSGYSLVHTFDYLSGDGRLPQSALVQASDSALYGTTSKGGSADGGIVFKLNPNGSGYTILHQFHQSVGDGQAPLGGLVEGSNHALYGATSGGGTIGNGILFAINPDGSGYTNLHSFGTTGGDGFNPQAPLVASGGVLFGISDLPGLPSTDGGAAVFRINEDGGGFSVVNSLVLSGGGEPGPLSKGSDGALYGTARISGVFGSPEGGVFKLNPDGTGFAWLHIFHAASGDGFGPVTAVVEAAGRLYGTTPPGGTNGYGTVFALDTDGGNYAVIKSFAGGEGAEARAGLLAARNGALYGTTVTGGASGRGSVFRVNPDGSGYTTIYSFGLFGDGANPTAALVAGSDGALYGTTYSGGTAGFGTVFKLNLDGSGYQVLRFLSGADGVHPQGGLLAASDGALYGTAQDGGANNLGTVFKLNLDGSSFTVLYNFTGVSGDGAAPRGKLIEGSDGALYGTTFSGGVSGYGTIFTLNKNGSDYSVLRTLSAADGTYPAAGLLQASDGDLYGTAAGLGSVVGGTVFKLHKNGTDFTVLRIFVGGASDGAYPSAELVEGNDGALYGTTSQGGPTGDGTVFALEKDGGRYTVVQMFNGTDGTSPMGALTIGGDGVIYGTATATVFKLECPLGPSFDAPGALDACSGANVTVTVLSTVTNGVCPRLITRTWAASDLCNNTNTCSQTITLTDTNPPVITCAPNKTVECGTAWTFDSPAATDDCCTNVTISIVNTVAEGACPQFVTRYWRATDCCGNSSTCGQTVTVVDTTPPALLGAPDKSVECGSVWDFDPPTASDTCSGTNVTITVLSTVTNGSCPTIVTRTWHAADPCGNQSNSKQTVTIVDTTPPVLFCGPDKSVECSSCFQCTQIVQTVLHSFSGGDGGLGHFFNTPASLIIGSDGALYGTTEGIFNDVSTVFRATTDGSSYQPILNLPPPSGPGVADPRASLLLASDNKLYGTTSESGATGEGAVFRLNQDGSGFAVLRDLAGATDGRQPQGALVEGTNGALYGTTPVGGTGSLGTVFTLDKGGTGFAVLHSFPSQSGDGFNPYGLLVHTNGLIYGVAENGGSDGAGILFSVAGDGSSYTILHSFLRSGGDGLFPGPGLVMGSDGAIYGATIAGGTDGAGTIFKFNPAGTGYAVVRGFSSSGGDGQNAYAGLSRGVDGAIYGTTANGGANNAGTVFRMNGDGTAYSVLWSFLGAAGSPRSPFTLVVQGGDGTLYGTSALGGTNGDAGTIFSIGCPETLPFDPPIGLDNCSGLNVAVSVLNTITHGTCPRLVTRTWVGTDQCGNTNVCSQTLSILPFVRDSLRISREGDFITITWEGSGALQQANSLFGPWRYVPGFPLSGYTFFNDPSVPVRYYRLTCGVAPFRGTISGTVSDSCSLLAGVTVSIVDSSGATIASGVTGSDGTYAIAGIPPETYTVKFTGSGHSPYSVSTVAVTPGAVATVNATLTSLLASVHVTVIDGLTTMPLSGVTVMIEYSSGPSAGPALTDGNGGVDFASQPLCVTATILAGANDGSGRTATVITTFSAGPNSVLIPLF
jgi:uncharacterized repeat protein (TIGR03803 family)